MAIQQAGNIRAPYGDIFFVQTPETDRTGQWLLQEGQRQDAMRRQFANQADQEMMRNTSNLKPVDVNNFIQKYSDYKRAKQNLLFNPKIQHDPIAYNQARQDADAKLADAMSYANESARQKNFLQESLKDYYKNPNPYKDEYPSIYNQAMGTPANEMQNASINGKPTDLTDLNNYRWGGVDQDFQDVTKKAIGSGGKTYETTVPAANDKTKNTVLTYSYGASPAAFVSNMDKSFGNHKILTNAAKAWQNLSPDEIDAVNNQYEKQRTNLDKWQQMTGEKAEQPLEYSPTNTAHNYAVFLARQRFNNENANVASKDEYNGEAVRTMKQANDLAKIQQKFANDKVLIALRGQNQRAYKTFVEDFKTSSANQQSMALDNMVGALNESAGQPTELTTPDGQKVQGKPLGLSSKFKQSFTMTDADGYKVQPDEIYALPDGTYLATKSEADKPLITESYSPESFKQTIGSTLLTRTQLQHEYTKPKKSKEDRLNNYRKMYQ